MAKNNDTEKSLEQWLWDAACAIRGAHDAPKFKDYILPLVFTKRLCDVFDDEVNRVASNVKSRARALELIEKDHKLVRFYLPFRAKNIETDPTWEVIRLLVAKENESLGQLLTDIIRSIAKENKRLDGIINRIDFNATTHGQRDIDDDSLNRLITKISEKKLGLHDVEPDIIGRSYEYLIRKFAEGGGQSAGEFYTPREVGMIMARILSPEPGMEAYDPNTGSAGLLIKMQLVLQEKMRLGSVEHYAPLKLNGQEFNPATWAMANMNMVIHDMDGEIAIGNTMSNPSRFDTPGNALKKFDLVTANPMWNQDSFNKSTYENDELNRFGHTHPDGTVVDLPPGGTADWAWVQHILASMKENGKAAIILDTGAVNRGCGSTSKSSEKDIRKWCIENDFIEGVIYLPPNLFYNTPAPGIILLLNKGKKNTEKQDRIFLVNANTLFTKGNPKNYIDDENADIIVDAFVNWKEVKKLSKIVNRSEIEQNDFNLSPHKFVQTDEDINHRELSILLTELNDLEEEAHLIQEELKEVLNSIVDTDSVDLKESPLGLIPKHWAEVKLSSLCNLMNGYAFKSGDYIKKSNTLNIRMSNIRPNGNFDPEYEQKFLPDEFAKTLSRFQLNDGDLIIAMTDMANSPKILGVPTLVKNKGDREFLLNQRVGKLTDISEDKVSADFLRFTLLQESVRSYYKGMAKKGVQINLGKNDILSASIPLPPINEQEFISKTLLLIQSYNEKQGQIQLALNEIFNTLLQHLMLGHIHENNNITE